MANKRDLKKNIDAAGAYDIEKMMDMLYNVKNVDKAQAKEAIKQVLGAIGAARSNANITFDKGVKAFGSLKEYSKAKKDFYKRLMKKVRADFDEDIDRAVATFNKAIPEEVREQLKQLKQAKQAK